MTSSSVDNRRRKGRLALCLVLLVLPALGCATSRDPVQITREKCWTKLLGPNPQVGPIAMTRDGKKLAATFYRDPGARYLDRVLRIFDLDSLTYGTFSLDVLAPWAPGEVTSLAWLDNGMTLDLLVAGNQTRLVRLSIADSTAHEAAACPDCIGIAISTQGRVARIDRYGVPSNIISQIYVDGNALAALPPSLAEYRPGLVTWSPNGSYLAVVFDRILVKPELPPIKTAVFSVGNGPPTVVGIRDQDGDSAAFWPDDESVVLTAYKEGVIRLYEFRPDVEKVLLDVNRSSAIAEEIGKHGIFYAQASADRSKVTFVSLGEFGELQIFVVDLPCMGRL